MARQGSIPGTERQTDAEVTNAGVLYRKARDKRMKLSKDEKAAKTALIEVMRAKKVRVYRDDEAVPAIAITLSETYNVKVENPSDVDDDEEPKD